MDNMRANSELVAKLEEKIIRTKRKMEDAETSQQRTNAESKLQQLKQQMRDIKKGTGKPSNYAQGGAVKKANKFTTCATCPTPSACTAAGKCAKAGYAKGGMVKKYAKGGYVNCGASVKPSQKNTPK